MTPLALAICPSRLHRSHLGDAEIRQKRATLATPEPAHDILAGGAVTYAIWHQLTGDLAKLSDAEIAAKFDFFWPHEKGAA